MWVRIRRDAAKELGKVESFENFAGVNKGNR